MRTGPAPTALPGPTDGTSGMPCGHGHAREASVGIADISSFITAYNTKHAYTYKGLSRPQLTYASCSVEHYLQWGHLSWLSTQHSLQSGRVDSPPRKLHDPAFIYSRRNAAKCARCSLCCHAALASKLRSRRDLIGSTSSSLAPPTLPGAPIGTTTIGIG